MGLAKQRMIELEQRHLSGFPDKSVCVKHFEDNTIKNFIRKNYDLGFCDYCNKELKVVSLETLMEFIMDGVATFYGDAVEFMGYNGREGGYLGETFTPDELIQDKVGLVTEPYEVTEDIVSCIEDIAWSQPDMYHDTVRDELMSLWDYFKNLIKHKARYLFSSTGISDIDDPNNAFKILSEVGRISKKFHLVQKIAKGTKLYRCRQHPASRKINTIEELVSPPAEAAIYPNRFSPSGISMLYVALDEATAALETISRTDKKKNTITISTLVTKKDLYVIDFNKLPKMPSIFEKKSRTIHYLTGFLFDLVRDFTKDISKDGKEHIEYVPTQVVTEYFRYPFNKNRKNKIEGIIYPSSKNEKKSAAVIFWDNEECLQHLKLEKVQRKKISLIVTPTTQKPIF